MEGSMSSRHPDDERLSRALVEAWHDQAADSSQVQRAYLRFLRKRQPARLRATALQVSRWILVGVALGMGTVYAATGPLRLLGRSQDVVVMRTLKPAPTTLAGRVPLPVPSSVDAPIAPVVALTLPQPSTSGSLTLPTPAASSSEQWQRAARGLRERDFETANAALEELARRGTSAERESAQLVQAQLLLSQGRESDAVSLLRTLRASADSASVRQKSAELLARVNESRPSQRSFAPAEGTNDP
jgi:hypothetical protein